MIARIGRGVVRVLDGVTALTAAQSAYLLGCGLAAVTRGGLRPATASGPLPRLAVLVPAHDEALMIAGAVGSLRACDYPPERRKFVVVADNCTDDTADRARRAGAEVLQRTDPAHPGKGPAVAWALERVRVAHPDLDAIVMMDADCTADPGLLRLLATELAAGADAVQGAFLASNPDASRSAALRWAGYALMNRVRPAGKSALGLSCGLTGSGMAFTVATLERVPWQAFSVTEDKEQHLRLLAAGVPVVFAAAAIVRSPMPTEQRTAATQQLRWETGNIALARRWAPRLLRDGLRRRDPDALHGAWELLVPPLSLLAAVQLGAGAAGGLLHRPRLVRSAGVGLTCLSGYVAIGLIAGHAPWSVYRALAGIPRLIATRLIQYVNLARGRGHRDWRRTTRDEPATVLAQRPAAAAGPVPGTLG